MPNIKTWAERSFADDSKHLATFYMHEEIVDLRKALAAHATPTPSDLTVAILELEVPTPETGFINGAQSDWGRKCFQRGVSATKEAAAALAKQVPAQEQDKWISVNERLPELNQEVLIWCGYRTLAQRSDDQHDPENHQGWCVDFDNGNAKAISHWMQLPPAPAQLAQSADKAGSDHD